MQFRISGIFTVSFPSLLSFSAGTEDPTNPSTHAFAEEYFGAIYLHTFLPVAHLSAVQHLGSLPRQSTRFSPWQTFACYASCLRSFLNGGWSCWRFRTCGEKG